MQERATGCKKELAEIAAKKREALALTQFLKVVLQNQLQEKVDEFEREFCAAKKRFAEAQKATNPFSRKRSRLQSRLGRLKKEKVMSEKKRLLRLEKAKKCESVLEDCLQTFDNYLNDIETCKGKGLYFRRR